MKKFVLVVLVVFGVIIASVASANNDPIWDDVWSFWKRLYNDEYEMFINTDYDSNGFAKDGIAYYAGYNCSLYENEYHSLSEIEDYFNYASENAGIKHFTTHVSYIGRDAIGRNVIKLTLHTTEDLTKIPGTNMECFDEPIYGIEMICWDRICIPYEER